MPWQEQAAKVLRITEEHVRGSKSDTVATHREKLDYERELFRHKKEKAQHRVWLLDVLIRVVLTGGAAYVTWSWITLISRVVLNLSGIDGKQPEKNMLSDGVLIAFLTTTTAQVIGVWLAVAAYVWYRPGIKSLTKKAESKKVVKKDDDSSDIDSDDTGGEAEVDGDDVEE